MRQALALASVATFFATAVAPGAATAATTTSNFDVSAQVTASAAVSATPLAFGTYNPTSATPTDGISTISVTATLGTTYSVSIDAGQGPGATIATRKLARPGNDLNYSIYQDSARSNVWGNSHGADTKVGTGSGTAQVLTAYGRIPAQQSVATGAYQDTLTVTVSY